MLIGKFRRNISSRPAWPSHDREESQTPSVCLRNPGSWRLPATISEARVDASGRIPISLRRKGSIGGLTVFSHAFLAISQTSQLTRTCARVLLCLRRETDGRGISGPRLFWNLESEATARCKNSAVTEGRQRPRLVSVTAEVRASLLTVTLTSVLRCAKQIRLSAPLIRLILSQRQGAVYVPLL